MHASLKYTLLFLVISTLLFVGYSAYLAEYRSVEISKALSARSDTTETLHQKIDSLLETLSAGLYDHYTRKNAQIQKLGKEAALQHEKSIRYLYLFFGTILLFALLFYLIDYDLLILFIGISALISLLAALFTPLVIMHVYSSLPVLGEVTLSFESKSLTGTIARLFSQSNYLIATLVLLFSVMIPLFKSLIIMMYGFFRESGFGRKSVKLIEKIGKWSMVDVFIVALLVVLFSTKQDIHTSLQIESGLYFFIGYVLLSMFGSTLLTAPRRER
ncbi:MAG TPA: paraquat-inducible protein A [Campylobacteraceae bacterium]|nr:paraquat-inducible protein A [Campylobacteraceae bacterium]